MPQQTLSVRMLGDFSLSWSESEAITIRSPRVRGLIAYLLLHQRIPQPRQRIAFLFWPDSSESQARTNLRFLLHQLRRELPEADNWVEADISHLQWKTASPFTLDVAEFEQAIATPDQAGFETEATLGLEQAVRLYRGDLLPGCFDDWVSDHRERLRMAFRTALERLTRSLANSGRYREAAAYAERLIRLDPLDERMYREAMRLHSLDFNRARALHVWHSCVNTLSSELGIQPARETQIEYERLLGQDVTKSITFPRWPSTIQQQAKPAYPLVGRDEELNQLLCAWHTASHGVAHMALIRGEAGIGKTRLTEEVTRRVQRRGIVAVSPMPFSFWVG
jgi:DNA-binding SARP family transcriptional activator